MIPTKVLTCSVVGLQRRQELSVLLPDRGAAFAKHRDRVRVVSEDASQVRFLMLKLEIVSHAFLPVAQRAVMKAGRIDAIVLVALEGSEKAMRL